ncbi:MAG: hypothetical protein ACE5GH_06685 [Fidelibacterota bacterium]
MVEKKKTIKRGRPKKIREVPVSEAEEGKDRKDPVISNKVKKISSSKPEDATGKDVESSIEVQAPAWIETIQAPATGYLLGAVRCSLCDAQFVSAGLTGISSRVYEHPWGTTDRQGEKCKLSGKRFQAPTITLMPIEEVRRAG